MYAGVTSTCGKLNEREIACPPAEIVRAEVVASRNSHVQWRRLYLRKVRQVAGAY